VTDFDQAAAELARAHQQRLTKPPGSLGFLEEIPVQLAGLQGTAMPSSRPAAAILFASDHPVTRHGVSAYPVEVTAAMVRNFVAGGAAASVLARTLGVPLTVVDVGVFGAGEVPSTDAVRFVRAPVAGDEAGDLRVEDAMSEATFARAVEAGAGAVDALPADVVVLVLGEMGIGNTTAASAVVGAGTGVAGAALSRKREVVRDAIERVDQVHSGEEAIRRLGGRDIAALFGAASRGCERGMAVLVDGFIVSAAILALVRSAPAARRSLLFAHRSDELGHKRVLEALEARPLLDLGLRLGEGSGALLALPLLDHACALHTRMATFASARVPEGGG
jgi:nicotinate-nucleotide--dimethylbenzimidazole phosphoribosyltransferase